jgi:hypothetical protein
MAAKRKRSALDLTDIPAGQLTREQLQQLLQDKDGKLFVVNAFSRASSTPSAFLIVNRVRTGDESARPAKRSRVEQGTRVLFQMFVRAKVSAFPLSCSLLWRWKRQCGARCC